MGRIQISPKYDFDCYLIPIKVVERDDLTFKEKILLSCIYSWEDTEKDNWCFFNMDKDPKAMGLNKRSVASLIGRLKRLEFLEIGNTFFFDGEIKCLRLNRKILENTVRETSNGWLVFNNDNNENK